MYTTQKAVLPLIFVGASGGAGGVSGSLGVVLGHLGGLLGQQIHFARIWSSLAKCIPGLFSRFSGKHMGWVRSWAVSLEGVGGILGDLDGA